MFRDFFSGTDRLFEALAPGRTEALAAVRPACPFDPFTFALAALLPVRRFRPDLFIDVDSFDRGADFAV
jgi:hypothetical protein